jgi:hypothetical protein
MYQYYIMSLSKQYPKFYKIVLNSANARYSNGDFMYEVNLPLYDNLHTKVGWVMGVDTFFTSSTIGGISIAGGGVFANLHCKELTQITSFSSEKKAQSDAILTFNSGNYQNFLCTNSVGQPIIDENFFVNKTLTLSFTDSTLTRIVAPSNSVFQCTICIWKAED